MNLRADRQVELGLYVGINGCSLKTEENLEMVKALPLDRLILETGTLVEGDALRADGADAPWCSVTSTSAAAPYLPTDDSGYFVDKASKPDRWKEGLGVKGRSEPGEVSLV